MIFHTTSDAAQLYLNKSIDLRTIHDEYFYQLTDFMSQILFFFQISQLGHPLSLARMLIKY